MSEKIKVSVLVHAPVEKVWQTMTEPTQITKWCFASPDWHAPKAENDLRVDGRFTTRMEAKDGSFGFDFGGKYTCVEIHQKYTYVMEDGREVEVIFNVQGDQTEVVELFDPETINPIEMQQQGWQMILENFKLFLEQQ